MAVDCFKTYVLENLRYEPETGSLFWVKQGRKGKRDLSKPVGTIKKGGYVIIAINNKSYYAHRIIWLMQTGGWPKHTIDHIDGDRANNKWSNLREATYSQNVANKPSRWGKYKYKGYFKHKNTGRYYVRIRFMGKATSFGGYDTEVEAAQVYNREAPKIFGEFANLNVIEEVVE